jgi:hypothetical protein
MKIKIWGHSKTSCYNRPILVSVLTKQEMPVWHKSEENSEIWHAWHFSNNYKINPLWSHNVIHICDHATFNVNCCYDILQHLLRICMSNKTFVKFLVIHNPTSLNCPNIFRSLNSKIYIAWKSVKAFGRWLRHIRRMLSQSQKFTVFFKKSCRVKTT